VPPQAGSHALRVPQDDEEDDAVPAMKLTPTAAMRARDVSRPRAEHLAEAETAEAAKGVARPGTGSVTRVGRAFRAERATGPGGDEPRKPAEEAERRSRRRRRG
jgi:hypothetical protein